uniref:Beta-lactamase domain-containing protein n=1 Tax=Elaeophora elaphi TaxID=1147741 RepID=A0A0R3RJZ1_9BILA
MLGHIITITVMIYAICIYINDNLYTKLPLHFDFNTIDDRFQLVANIFKKNFADGWERGGAALTVYFEGQKVLDIWGGYADVQAARKWQMDTITSTFSCLKAAMTLCVALLVERKLALYDDPVIKYWPNFGNNGKANITIQMLLSQTAGLAYFDKSINLEIASNHQAMREMLENEQPKWLPRQESGCYGPSYYWLIDQLIRHIDKQKRGVQQYFHDEIASKFGIDYLIGLEMTEEHRVARITMPSWSDMLSEIYQTPYLIKTLLFQFSTAKDSIKYKVMHNLNWLDPTTPLQINNPNFHHLLYHGFGNARSLAQIFHMITTDKLLSPATQLLLRKLYDNSTNICTMKHLAKGMSFLVFINQSQVTHDTYGHSGFGCQQVIYDSQKDLTIAYVTNALKIGIYEKCRTYIRLQNAIYDIVEKVNQI